MNFAETLKDAPRLLIEVDLKPAQGTRFQPTGFPDLGAADYQAHDGTRMVLVESAQSMANRLEAVCWDEGSGRVVDALVGLPYVESQVEPDVTTSSIVEAHRLNSPYIVNSDEFQEIAKEIGFEKDKPFDRRKLAAALLKYDPSSLLHGVFLEKVGGVVRLPRALSGFIEARNVTIAASGGVKVDRVQPATSGESTKYGKAADGYGNVPYHRDEYTAEAITAYFNLDLALLRGLGLRDAAVNLLIGLALFKIQRFLNEGLRLRTACDLEPVSEPVVTRPKGWVMPPSDEVAAGVARAIEVLSAEGAFASPPVTTVRYQKGKKKKGE